jgi:hypothetical protein
MKKMITMSLVAAATTFAFGSTANDIADLQSQIDKLKTKQGKINAHTANDNIKWGVDLRTSVDNINYDMADGTSRGNDALMGMRLWLNMAYAPDSHNIFKGRLSMNKAFGADFGMADQSDMTGARGFGMGSLFDWTGNEALADNSLKVKEAYWLYQNDTFMGTNIAWTASAGRRPSTDGLGINLRENQDAKSPLSHTVNVEFDGASFRFNLDKITPLTGSWIKLCMGRGLTNATPRFTQDGSDYAEDKTLHGNADMVGLIFVPYDDGQYSIHIILIKTNHIFCFCILCMYRVLSIIIWYKY